MHIALRFGKFPVIILIVKQFIEHIQKSIYGPDFYRELLSAPLSRSFKYFTNFVLFFAVVLTILTSIPIVPVIPSLLRDGARGIVEYIPVDLEIRIVKGVVETTVNEPYFLPHPSVLYRENAKPHTRYLFVIDTKTPFSPEVFASSSATMWIGRDFIAYTDRYGLVSHQKIDARINAVINRAAVERFVTDMRKYFVYIPPFLVGLFFIGFFLFGYIQIVYLLFAALCIWLLLFALGIRTSYGGAYRVGVHAITLPLMFQGILILFGLQQAKIPFLFTIILLAVVYFNFQNARRLSPGAETQSGKPITS